MNYETGALLGLILIIVVCVLAYYEIEVWSARRHMREAILETAAAYPDTPPPPPKRKTVSDPNLYDGRLSTYLRNMKEEDVSDPNRWRHVASCTCFDLNVCDACAAARNEQPLETHMRKTIYLAGPINGRSDDDCKTWREEAKSLINAAGHKFLDPMARDYRGREHEEGIAQKIVDGDLEDIAECDALIVYFDQPSVGTAMEVFYAHKSLGKRVIVINKSTKPLSPWMLVHCSAVVSSVFAAVELLHP